MTIPGSIRGGLDSIVEFFSRNEDPCPGRSPEDVENVIKLKLAKMAETDNEREYSPGISSSDPDKLYEEVIGLVHLLKVKKKIWPTARDLYKRYKKYGR